MLIVYPQSNVMIAKHRRHYNHLSNLKSDFKNFFQSYIQVLFEVLEASSIVSYGSCCSALF